MDIKIFTFINDFTGRVRLLDIFMMFISQKLRYLFAFVLIIMWFRDHYHKRVTSYAGISAFISLLVSSMIKIFFYKPRPFLKKSVNLLAPVPSKRNSTFPSKHTTLAFAVSTTILFYKRTLGMIMSISALLAGLSRIWMGQHYPSDIIGSIFIGSFVAFCVKITTFIWDPLFKNDTFTNRDAV